MRSILLRIGVQGAPVVVMVMNGLVGGCGGRSRAHTDVQRTRQNLGWLSGFIREQARASSEPYPQGDIMDLEVWLNDKCRDRLTNEEVQLLLVERPAAVVRRSGDGTLRLRDVWGHALVYRYPPSSPEFLFRLYSLGPNGVDEDGKGGNIDGSPDSK